MLGDDDKEILNWHGRWDHATNCRKRLPLDGKCHARIIGSNDERIYDISKGTDNAIEIVLKIVNVEELDMAPGENQYDMAYAFRVIHYLYKSSWMCKDAPGNGIFERIFNTDMILSNTL